MRSIKACSGTVYGKDEVLMNVLRYNSKPISSYLGTCNNAVFLLLAGKKRLSMGNYCDRGMLLQRKTRELNNLC